MRVYRRQVIGKKKSKGLQAGLSQRKQQEKAAEGTEKHQGQRASPEEKSNYPKPGMQYIKGLKA